uniref:Uncharacterized protein LOC111115090 isoform X2 n=1 Tax=Crassostrea virginica TaxID=6565 RepID=A0A8B8C1C8_CRAVI|nr:uncharacterized protein LOC111115090 isoform X2 [Crassostrea virginica]
MKHLLFASMEERFELECNGATEMLQELFNFKLTRINEDPSQFSLCNNILKAIQIDDLLQDIRPPSRKDEVRGNYPSILDLVKPGSVFVFEVVVIPDKHGLQIKEKDSSKKGDFFQLVRSINTVKVIRIYSRSVRVIDAKLCVYNEYKHMITETVLLHHDFEGYEEIAKLSGVQKLQSLINILLFVKDNILQDSLKNIVEEAAGEVFTLETITDLCYAVCLQDGDDYIGTTNSRSYCCRSIFTVKRIKRTLVQHTLEAIAKLLVNINDKLWRRSVAIEIYHCIMENRNMLMYGILREIRKMCTRTISDLDKALKQLERFKDRMVLLNQQELITEWENRQIFNSEASIIELANDQSVLGYIAGRVNGKPAVKVFLQHDDKKAVSYVFKNCKYPENIHFMNVTEKLKVNAVREINKLAVASIDTSTRNLLHAIIQKEGERIMATHSTVVGIGISRIKDVGAPCIALFCLDKQLIPFGEHKIPEQIEGFPVDIREY